MIKCALKLACILTLLLASISAVHLLRYISLKKKNKFLEELYEQLDQRNLEILLLLLTSNLHLVFSAGLKSAIAKNILCPFV